MILEYQRYGRNKDTLVDKTYIDGGEYRRKYDNATDNPAVNKALYNAAKAALKHRSGTTLEDMYWFDSETGEIIFSYTDSTDERIINYSARMNLLLSGKNNIITLHTHPGSMPPSIEDFNSCCRRKYVCGFVACHNGRLFRYSSEAVIEEKLYDMQVRRGINIGLSEFDAQLLALNKLKQSYKIDFTEVI